jgi:hypothetical protein
MERKSSWFQILLFVGGIVLFGFVLWVILDWYSDPQTSVQKKDLVQAVGLILAGVAGAIGIFFTWRGQRITRESLESSRDNTERQLILIREGQITERFTKAIEQLGATDAQGHQTLELRLGGIYALERIARESETDHWPIMEVLTAYVRQHASWRPEEEDRDGEEGEAGKYSEGGSRRIPDAPEATGLAPDIQAILTILRRRTRHYEHGEPEPLDLSGTNLGGANLQGAHLEGANLSRANLGGANLEGAYLEDAYLIETNLIRADLIEATLRDAKLIGAYLWGAVFWNADLSGADLQQADPTQEQLNEANGDESTRLPSGLNPPLHWSVKTDEQTEGD